MIENFGNLKQASKEKERITRCRGKRIDTVSELKKEFKEIYEVFQMRKPIDIASKVLEIETNKDIESRERKRLITAVLESWEEDIVDEVRNGDKYEPF